MKLYQLKALTCATIALSLAACSTAKKTDTASNESYGTRTPAQSSEGFQKVVSILKSSSQLGEQEISQELDKMVQNMSKKVPGFAGATYQSVVNDPVLSQKLADAIVAAIKRGDKGDFNKKFKIKTADINSTVAAIKKAKTEIANASKIGSPSAKSDLSEDAVTKFWGADVARLYNGVPTGIKDQVKTRMRNAMQVALDMPAKKGTVTEIVTNSLKVIDKTKNDFLGRWVCVTWGDMRNEQALDNLLTISKDVLKEVEGGAKINKPTDLRPIVSRSLASVRKESVEAVDADLKDLGTVCETTNPAMELAN